MYGEIGAIPFNPNGNYVNVYTAPDPELLGLQAATDGQKRRDRRGAEYTQTMLDTSGTKEGERVETWGMVEAAPKPVNRGKNSPLQFFLDVASSDKEGEKERWEVYASNKAKQQVKARKLSKDDRIHVVLYKHTWTVDLQDGSETTHTRYNLATIIEIEKHEQGSPAKRNMVNAPTS